MLLMASTVDKTNQQKTDRYIREKYLLSRHIVIVGQYTGHDPECHCLVRIQLLRTATTTFLTRRIEVVVVVAK